MHVTFKVYVFSEEGDQTLIKTDGPGNPVCQNTSVIASSKLCIPDSFKSAGWAGPTSQTISVKT